MDNKPIIFNHPLIQHKLSLVRDKRTGSKEFRELISEIAMLMCYEATRDLSLEEVNVETPMGPAHTKVIAGRKLACVPVLRAGLGMVDGILNLIPAAKVGHIGIYRDHETHRPVEYYCKLPADIQERDVIVLDPMLATGGSAVDAIGMIKDKGVTSIKFMCIIAAPEGLRALVSNHPDVQIYCAALDERLDENKYIIPGLGDAGDRIFGTK
ncbi:MAG: uracil phosphoribosyltransferase [Oscillospiraceae bacterium]|nr:uracil phosphoribosyltransferase [Oscillospiraceae bacterium]